MRNIIAGAALVAVLMGVALSAPTAGAQGSTTGPRTETRSSGTVSARLTYRMLRFSQARNVRLAITRAGVPATLPDGGRVAAACEGCEDAAPAGGLESSGRRSLTLADLTGDGEPEVIVDLYTGGLHCCWVSAIYGWDPATGTYRSIAREWGDPSYSIERLTGGPGAELVSADARFAYAFCAFVCSAMPVQIWRYEDFGLVDVTRRFPAQVRADLRSIRGTLRRARRHRDERFSIKGLLPALCADLHLLDRGAQCRRELRRALRRGELRRMEGDISESYGRAYIRSVLAFLARNGYRA